MIEALKSISLARETQNLQEDHWPDVLQQDQELTKKQQFLQQLLNILNRLYSAQQMEILDSDAKDWQEFKEQVDKLLRFHYALELQLLLSDKIIIFNNEPLKNVQQSLIKLNRMFEK